MGFFRILLYVAALISVFVAYQVRDDGRPTDITLVKNTHTLDAHLQRYARLLGGDYEGYRNHCIRVLTFTLHLLPVRLATKYRADIELALAYHDIALWTDKRLDYTEPSGDRAERAAERADNARLHPALVRLIVTEHHKLSEYRHPLVDAEWVQVIEAVRKADLIDFSLGIFAMGVSRGSISVVINSYPNAGFHQTLLGFPFRIKPVWELPMALYELSKIFKA